VSYADGVGTGAKGGIEGYVAKWMDIAPVQCGDVLPAPRPGTTDAAADIQRQPTSRPAESQWTRTNGLLFCTSSGRTIDM
jgi:hypothetical protein